MNCFVNGGDFVYSGTHWPKTLANGLRKGGKRAPPPHGMSKDVIDTAVMILLLLPDALQRSLINKVNILTAERLLATHHTSEQRRRYLQLSR